MFQVAGELGLSAAKSFNKNLDILSDAVRNVRPDAQLNIIGKINGSPIYGSLVSKIGIAEVNGVTVVVKVTQEGTQILGKVPN